MAVEASRCREYREGWLGRKRTYLCRRCGDKFQVDTRDPLPGKERICRTCRDMDCHYCHEYCVVDGKPACTYPDKPKEGKPFYKFLKSHKACQDFWRANTRYGGRSHD